MGREIIYWQLQRCKGLHEGRHLQALMLASGLYPVAALADHLIRIFASCRSLLEANLAFCTITDPSIFTWHSILSAYVSLGESSGAIDLYAKMQAEGILPDQYIHTCVLKACADKGAIKLGMHTHDLIIRGAVESDVVVGSAIIHMYATCGALDDANKGFCKLLNRNAVSWNTLLVHCNQHGYGDSALEIYDEMQQQGVKPERSTFSSILKACADLGAIEQGRFIHEQVIKNGMELDVVVGSTLVDMYCKCGNLKVARETFDKMLERDIVSWGAMIYGYVEQGDYSSAMELFARLLQENIVPNKVVYACILKACASIRAVGQARWIHHHIIRSGAESERIVGSTLVDMYGRCGSLDEAFRVFDLMPDRDVVLWNTVVAACTQHGHGSTALRFYFRMRVGHVKPDRITFLQVSKACGYVGSLHQGRLIHDHILRDSFDSDFSVGSAIVDMYAKCGSLKEARALFDKLPAPNAVSWGSLISGYTQLGHHELVEQCFYDMTRQGMNPSATIYVNVLASCSHAGQVKDIQKYLKSMLVSHGVTPSTEHFNCMIDALGRAGRLKEAKVLLESMPGQGDITCWMSLLASCKTYNEVDLARQCFEQLIKMDPDYASAYVLMSRLYTEMDMVEQANKIRKMRWGSSAWKKPAVAWLDAKDSVQEFRGGSTQGSTMIQAKVRSLKEAMLVMGYMPQISIVDVENEEDGLTAPG